jgi:hypothetical protein
MECVELAPAFSFALGNEIAPKSKSGGKPRALHTLRADLSNTPFNAGLVFKCASGTNTRN